MSEHGSATGDAGRAAHLGDELSALLDGELAASGVAAAERHLAGCPACARELARVSQARTWVRGLPAIEPPAAFFGGIVAERTAQVVLLRHRRRARVSVAACAAAAGLVLSMAPPRERPTAPQVGQLVEAHATAGGSDEPLTQLVPVGVPVSFGR